VGHELAVVGGVGGAGLVQKDCGPTLAVFAPESFGQLRLLTETIKLKVGNRRKVGHPVQIESWVELKEFTKALNIGDRIQVLCDDGVLVAEKISHTQFKFIHAQMLSEFVH
jgi:hypothetical protein